MSSLLAAWAVSLRRTRADWPIVVAAWLITLLAAILFSAGLIYPSSAAEAGLRRALEDAAPGITSIDASMYAEPEKAIEIDPGVIAELQAAIANLGGTVVRDWRSGATLAVGKLPGAVDGDQALVGYLDGLAEHATLVEGAWPANRAGAAEPIQVVAHEGAAAALGIGVGEVITLVAHPSTQPVEVPARLVGVFTVNAATEPFWDEDGQLLTGIRENLQFRAFGPFLTTRDDLLSTAGLDSLRLLWRTLPDFERLRVDDASSFRFRIDALRERLGIAAAEPVQITTELSALLREAERSLLVSRTSVLLVMAQLALLAAYAIVLTATLLVDHRRVDTSMLRSRGAGAGQVAFLALLEGLLLAVPAVLVAPWLAVAVLNVFNVAGPLADVGLRIDPRVSTDAYLGAAAAGIVCVALLVLPAALSARRFAAAQGDISRQETRTFGQRMGLDIAFLAVTGIALWQLRLYGAPLTRTVQGSLGLDPLLVAAPAIALIAGAVLALRILPLLAQAIEGAISRGRSLVASLGSRQLARRPLRYTRSALLLMLAMSMGVFALSYATTWATSQRDQAAYQAGADARVVLNDAPGAVPAWALPGAYAALTSVAGSMPVERVTNGAEFPLGGAVDLLAIDAAAAPDVVLARGDEGDQPLGALLAPLVSGRPATNLTALPVGTTHLRMVPTIDIRSITQYEFTSEGPGEATPLDPSTLQGLRVSVNAIIRDARGLLYRASTGTVPWDGPGTALVLSLLPGATPGQGVDGPVGLASIGMELWLPDFTFTTDATIGIGEAEAGAGADGPWTAVSLDAPDRDAWNPRLALGRDVPNTVPDDTARDATIDLASLVDLGGLFGAGTQVPAAVLSFVPSSMAAMQDVVPAIANQALLDSLEALPGETLTVFLAGDQRRLEITGVVGSFPTTDPATPLLMLDEPTLGLLRLQGETIARDPDEWWLKAAGDVETLAADLRAAPLATTNVVTVVDRTRSLSTDPVALGIIGALTLGFVATGLFAIVGLTVSTAVGARQRRTEFALLRALGLSGRQLAASLWLENGSLVLVSLAAGTGLGLLIGWLVLPFVTVTQQATTPVPAVIVHVPWDGILLLDLASAVALGLAVVIIGAVLRRIGVGSVLRMGED